MRFPAQIRPSIAQKTARSYRLKQLMLMTVRSLLLGLVAFSMARPFWSASDAQAVTQNQQGAAVFVLDANYQ